MRRRTSRLLTAALALLGALVVWGISARLFPYYSLNHDEAVYLQQAAMLLEGRVNLWPPVEDALRPWFFVEAGDRLYSKYSPVPAAMFALGRLLGGYRLALAGIAAATLALVAGVVREVFDRPTGLVAAGFVLASPLFLLDSSVFLPYAPTALLNLGFAYGYLRADRTGDARWAAAAGAAVGLAFFARPFTAVTFAAPFVLHALWTLRTDWRGARSRQGLTAALGLLGVGTALAYNAAVTGSPWLFPYQAFARLDGLGFGRRRLLDHAIRYTPELALRANWRVVGLFGTEWVAGGVLGTALAVGGLGRTVRYRLSDRTAALAGLVVSITAGNVLFWGNYNILGDLDRAGDGLVSVLGPYYHFDLLLPTAAFAAVGIHWSIRVGYRLLDEHLDRRRALGVAFAGVVVSAGAFGSVTAANLGTAVERNAQATETYERAYAPFEGGPPDDSLVLLPDPYGPWLNHPHQPLRNDPGFDGPVVYALDGDPFAVRAAFPDRTVYRYTHRGAWAPSAGSPEAARLRRVRDVSGPEVRLTTTLGVPDGAVGITARIATDEGSIYYVASNVTEPLDVDLAVSDGRVRAAGGVRAVGDDSLAVEGRDTVRLYVFVDYGPGGGFTYRFDLPVEVGDGRVRALSPRIERCRDVRTCGGAAAHVPETAPDGVFVRSNLTARDPNP